MNYNAVISALEISDDSGTITEPVTRDEVKDYLRLRGFQDLDDSPATDIGNMAFDDTFISESITAVRQMFEEMCGLSLVYHAWEVVLHNMCGRIELPYGPIKTIQSVKDSTGAVVTFTTVGNFWKYLVTPTCKDLTVTYEAGFVLYNGLPKDIKLDLLRSIAFYYINRGDDSEVKPFVSQLAMRYSRNIIA